MSKVKVVRFIVFIVAAAIISVTAIAAAAALTPSTLPPNETADVFYSQGRSWVETHDVTRDTLEPIREKVEFVRNVPIVGGMFVSWLDTATFNAVSGKTPYWPTAVGAAVAFDKIGEVPSLVKPSLMSLGVWLGVFVGLFVTAVGFSLLASWGSWARAVRLIAHRLVMLLVLFVAGVWFALTVFDRMFVMSSWLSLLASAVIYGMVLCVVCCVSWVLYYRYAVKEFKLRQASWLYGWGVVASLVVSIVCVVLWVSFMIVFAPSVAAPSLKIVAAFIVGSYVLVVAVQTVRDVLMQRAATRWMAAGQQKVTAVESEQKEVF